MKKILTTLAVSSMALGAFAQGYVNWGGSPAGAIETTTNSTAYSGLSSALGGGQSTGSGSSGITRGLDGNVYYFELLYSTVDTTTPTTLSALTSDWTATGLLMEDVLTANNGRINPINGSSASAIDPSYSGGNLQLMIVGWSANLGTIFEGNGGVLSELNNWGGTFAPLANSYFGLGFVGTGALSTSSASGTTIWNTSQSVGGKISNPIATPEVLNLLQATPTPEPGTMALAALGGASLLLFRRKK